MSVNKFGNYLVRPMQTFAAGEPTTMHAIAEMGYYKPYVMKDVVTRMFTANVKPTLRSIIEKHTQVREFDSDTEYTWQVAGTAYENIPLIEARKADGSVVNRGEPNVGKYGEIIYLLFPKKYFFNQEIIVGTLNEHYQFRIIDEPREEGTNYLYTTELMAGSDTGINGDYLQAGERFSYEFILVEQELSEGAGGVRVSTASNMRNEFSVRRKSKKFTGRANQQQKLQVTVPIQVRESNGKVVTKNIDNWFLNEEWAFYREWGEEEERLDLYARSNRRQNGTYANTGRSGLPIREGNGLMAQMEYGNVIQYNGFNEDFDLDGLESALYAVCEKGNVPMSQRTFMITTGNRGMAQAHKSIDRTHGGWVRNDAVAAGAIAKVKNEVHQNSLAAGYQFTELRSPNGLTLQFVYEPGYDDPVRNKLAGPRGQGVMNSYRYDIWDMGSSSEPNMFICKVKGFKSYAKYILGMNNPWGIDDKTISHSEDSSSVEIMDISGACVLDPSRCLSYIPSQLAV